MGIDTLDHELDLWSEDGASWHLKDEDGVHECVTNGRFNEREAEPIRADAVDFQTAYAREGPWWDLAWADWRPPADLATPALPEGWELVPAA